MHVNFIDTNILIYTLSNEIEKQEVALALLSKQPVISVQVLSEASNVMGRKLSFDIKSIKVILDRISSECSIIEPITLSIFRTGLDISERYGYSHYDSQIIAAALESGCHTLYSEDMQHNQVIDNELIIINPFLD